MNVEEELIRAFVIKERRERLVAGLANPRRRRQVLDSLNHFGHLDARYAQIIVPIAQTPQGIANILKGKGAPDACYVISGNAKLDGQEMPLTAALERVVGMGLGTFISCVPGMLGYFEGEEAGARYVLDRRPV
jgi:hypothetical protein